MTIKLEGNFWTTVLFLIFLTLKLNGTITWSWWWVCAPIWAPPVLALIIIIIGALWVTYDNKSRGR